MAIEVSTEAASDAFRPDFYCGDEVHGNRTQLRAHYEAEDQGYVLRVPANFRITLPSGRTLTCADAAAMLRTNTRRWEMRSAGAGSQGQRWYARAWPATTSPRHHLLIRKHLRTGELAFHYCYVPENQLCTKARLIRAAGLRWPVEEGFEFGKDCFGLDQSQVRLYTAIARHTMLVMAALAICAVTAALLRDKTDSQPPPPIHPDQPPPAEVGHIPLTVPEIKHLIADAVTPARPPGHKTHWMHWRRTHQARSRWFHIRARLTRDAKIAQVS